MLLVDQMMAEEIKNVQKKNKCKLFLNNFQNTLSAETEETLELMNEHLVANLGNNSSTFNQTAENIDGPTMSNENVEMMGNGTNEMETTTKMMTAKMLKMRKKSRRKQGMMVNVEKQILVDNSVEQEEEEEEEEENAEGVGKRLTDICRRNGLFPIMAKLLQLC